MTELQREPGCDDDTPLPKSFAEVAAGMGLKAREPKPVDWSAEIPRRQAMFLESSMERRPFVLKSVGAPPEMVDLVCGRDDLLDDTFAMKKASEWNAGPEFLMLMLGAPRVGKSLAAVWTMAQRTFGRREQYGAEPWIEIHRFADSQAFVKAVELANLKQWDQESTAMMKKLKSVGMLVLDDLGREWVDVGKRLEEILVFRHSRNLRTVLTANMNAAGFSAQYGDRLFSRIRRDGMVVEC